MDSRLEQFFEKTYRGIIEDKLNNVKAISVYVDIDNFCNLWESYKAEKILRMGLAGELDQIKRLTVFQELRQYKWRAEEAEEKVKGLEQQRDTMERVIQSIKGILDNY